MTSITKVEQEMKLRAKKGLLNNTDPCEKLKLRLLERGAAGIKNLTRTFRIMDDDGSKHLNFEEFLTGVHDVGLRDLSEGEIKQIFSKYDKNGDGSISVTEFLLQLQPPMSRHRLELVHRAFAKLDKDGSGTVTVDDLEKQYDVGQHPKYLNGDWTVKECLQEYLKSFDSGANKDGKVTMEEFEAYYAALSASIDTDSYFDLMMRRAWNI